MKLVLRIFNIFILAIAAVATVCLFALPTFTFNSNIALDVKGFSQFIPSVPGYTDNIDIAYLIGTDTIQVGISFELNFSDTTKVVNGNRDIINNQLISKNVDDIVNTLHEPVDLITDFTIRSVIKTIIENEVTTQIQAIIDDSGGSIPYTAEEIKSEVGMDDIYFKDLSYLLYDSANEDGATVDSVTNVLFDQIDEALAEIDYAMEDFDKSGFGEENKAAIKTNLSSVLDDLQLINSDNTLKKISQISYIYLSDYLKTELTGKVADTSELDKRTDETDLAYADRLLSLFVLTQTPDLAYQIVGYVALGLIIGLFVFAFLWVILFTITLIKTFSKNKPWTIFGPWFWVFGSLQIVLGIGLLVLGKFVLPNINLSITGLPLKRLILAPRTAALIPSMIFIGCIFVAIAYAVLRSIAKRQYKNAQYNNNNGGGYNNGGYDPNGYYGPNPNNGYNNNGYNNNGYGNNGYDPNGYNGYDNYNR